MGAVHVARPNPRARRIRPAREHRHGGDHPFRHAVVVRADGGMDVDAAGHAGRDIDVVEPRTEPPRAFQPGRRARKRAFDPGPVAHDRHARAAGTGAAGRADASAEPGSNGIPCIVAHGPEARWDRPGCGIPADGMLGSAHVANRARILRRPGPGP